jgi:hypothetical protein
VARSALAHTSRDGCTVIEPVIGHLGRLKGPAGNTTNAILSAFGRHSRPILAWLSNTFLRLFLIVMLHLSISRSAFNPASLVHGRSELLPRLPVVNKIFSST